MFANIFYYAGLTLYDMHRESRTPVVDDSITTIAIRTLNKASLKETRARKRKINI